MSSPKTFFYHQKSSYYLQVKHNVRFLPQNKQFCHSLGFPNFYHNLKEITKEKEEKEIKECVVGVNM